VKRLVAVVALVLGGLATPAAADDGDDNRGGRNRNGDSDCRDARAACEDNDGFNFEDSPVEDSFSPVICLPGSTCHVDRGESENEMDGAEASS
jgi:hypothetical protein